MQIHEFEFTEDTIKKRRRYAQYLRRFFTVNEKNIFP
jgi:hypothetical protein